MARGGRKKGKMREQNGISVLHPDFGRGRECFFEGTDETFRTVSLFYEI